MDVIVTRQFEKDTERELSKKMQLKLAEIIEDIRKSNNLLEVRNIKKLKGFKNAYRIKMGEFRIGFVLNENIVMLSRIMNRKEIYRYFP